MKKRMNLDPYLLRYKKLTQNELFHITCRGTIFFYMTRAAELKNTGYKLQEEKTETQDKEEFSNK